MTAKTVKHGSRYRVKRNLSRRTQRALCALAEKLSATPAPMVEEDWEPLRKLGFDDRACMEVAQVVGVFNYSPDWRTD